MLSKPSPVLKWAGGKTKLLPQIRARYPQQLSRGTIDIYIEPFLGGGAVFFDIVNNFKIEKAYLFDTNPELVILYKVIQYDVDSLISELSQIAVTYLALEEQDRKIYYYSQREQYNNFDKQVDTDNYCSKWTKRAALTIFLNKTCFNGLYRVNNQGKFNVPMGKYKNPSILNIDNLRAVNQAFKTAHIAQKDFAEVIKIANNKTFIYYDPPYRPISKTASFNSYSVNEFGDREQLRLRDVFVEASQFGAMQMLSNSDPTNYTEDDFFDDLYQQFKIDRISASRAINSKADSRGTIREIIVTNY